MEVRKNNNNNLFPGNESTPYIQIIIQPEEYKVFRYVRDGPHGPLKGRIKPSNDEASYPTVELRNYSGEAFIKCHLYDKSGEREHPHKFHDGEPFIKIKVPHNNSYIVSFKNLYIMHTYKHKLSEVDKEELDLNAVRLRFSAHYVGSDKQICEPEFSEPIYNQKNASSNQLAIVRSSRCDGSMEGNEEVLLFVSKVKPGEVRINFFELDAKDKRVWEHYVNLEKDQIHMQCGIVFKTPKYTGPRRHCASATVYFELERLGRNRRTSPPVAFTYRAPALPPGCKRRRLRHAPPADNSFVMTPGSQSEAETQDTSIQQGFENNNLMGLETQLGYDTGFSEPVPSSNSDLNFEQVDEMNTIINSYQLPLPADESELLSILNTIDFAEYEKQLIEPQGDMPVFQMRAANSSENVNSNVFDDYGGLFADGDTLRYQSDTIGSTVNDQNRISLEMDCGSTGSPPSPEVEIHCALRLTRPNILRPTAAVALQGTHPKHNNSRRIKQLIREIHGLKKETLKQWYAGVRKRLDALLGISFDNGDSILHVLLKAHLPSFKFLVELISSLRLYNLLNIVNNDMQTILHTAIINEMPGIVPFLIEKGCAPGLRDAFGHTSVHQAVRHSACLPPLLSTLSRLPPPQRARLLDCQSGELGTALELAAELGRGACARALLAAGAGARGPALRLAAARRDRALLADLLLHIPKNRMEEYVNESCGGETALQAACAAAAPPLVRMLLRHKADPYWAPGGSEPAWRMARRDPRLWRVVRPYLKEKHRGDHVSEDEYSSSDDTTDCDDGSTSLNDSSDASDDFVSAEEGNDDTPETALIATLKAVNINNI